MNALKVKVYHYERPVKESKKTPKKLRGGKTMIDMAPADLTWKSLIANGLCLGLQSPCIVGQCEVMCGYGRRYLEEKDQHAG